MSTTQRRPPGSSTAASNGRDDLVESALEALRREWRAGCNGRMVRSLATASVKRLRERAATQQSAEALAEVEARLTAYRTLPRERRKDELTQIANALNAL